MSNIGGAGGFSPSSSYDDLSSHEDSNSAKEKDQNLETNKKPVDQTTSEGEESQESSSPEDVQKVLNFNLTGSTSSSAPTSSRSSRRLKPLSELPDDGQSYTSSRGQYNHTSKSATDSSDFDDSTSSNKKQWKNRLTQVKANLTTEDEVQQKINQNNNNNDQTNPAASNAQNIQSQGTGNNNTESASEQGKQNNTDTNNNIQHQIIGNVNVQSNRDTPPPSNSQQPNSTPVSTSTTQPVNNDNNNVDDNASGIDLAGVFEACKNIDTYIKNNGRGTVPPEIEDLIKRVNAKIEEETKDTSLFEQAKDFVFGKSSKKIKLLRSFGPAGDAVGIQYGNTKSTFYGTNAVSSSKNSNLRADNYELLKTLKEELGAQAEDANPRYEIDLDAGTLTIINGEEKITYYFPVPLDPEDLIAIIRGPDGNIALNPDEIKVANSGTNKLKKRIREVAQDKNNPYSEICKNFSHAIDGMSSNVPQSGDKPDNNKYLITSGMINIAYIQTNENNLFRTSEADQPNGDQLNESQVQEILQKTYNISNQGAFLNSVEQELRRSVPQQSATNNVQPQNEKNAASNDNNAANNQSDSRDAEQFADRIMSSYNAITAQRFEDQNRTRITAFLTNLHKKKKEADAQLAAAAAEQNNNEVARLSDAQIRTIISESLRENSNPASASNPANPQQNPGAGSGEAGQNVTQTDAASGNGGNQQRQDQAEVTPTIENDQTNNNGDES